MTRAAQHTRLLADAFKRPAFSEPEHAPTYTLDRQIAEARTEMGERRWQELRREWE